MPLLIGQRPALALRQVLEEESDEGEQRRRAIVKLMILVKDLLEDCGAEESILVTVAKNSLFYF